MSESIVDDEEQFDWLTIGRLTIARLQYRIQPSGMALVQSHFIRFLLIEIQNGRD